MTAYQPVEALLRGLKVLETVSRLETCGVRELQAATGLSRATLIRMLETLEFAGYVTREPGSARHALTSRVRLLSAGYRATDAMAARATPILADLQSKVAWPCDLAIYDGAEMVIVAGNPAEGRLFYNRGPGFRAPVLGTSLGLAYIAFASDLERSRVLAVEAVGTGPGTDLARDPASAQSVFDRIRARGYAMVDHRGSDRGPSASLAAIACPVIIAGRPVAALNVIFLREVLAPEVAETTLTEPLREAAVAVATAVGDLFD